MRAAVILYPSRRPLPLRRILLFLAAVLVVLLLTGWAHSPSGDKPRNPVLPFRLVESHSAPPVDRSVDPNQSVRDLVRFDRAWWAATGSGLLRISTAPRPSCELLTRHDGLPENDVTALAVFRGDLYVGTRGSGLARRLRDGTFVSWRASDPAWNRVTSLLSLDADRLLVGTEGGLLSFDGASWRIARFARGTSVPLPVTCLSLWGDRVAVGTREGLFVETGEGLRRFDRSPLLPSGRITALGVCDDALIVGTGRGTVSLTADLVLRPFLPQLGATTVQSESRGIWLGSADGTIRPPGGEPVRSNLGAVHKLAFLPNGAMLAATSRGLFATETGAEWKRWAALPPAAPTDPAAPRSERAEVSWAPPQGPRTAEGSRKDIG